MDPILNKIAVFEALSEITSLGFKIEILPMTEGDEKKLSVSLLESIHPRRVLARRSGVDMLEPLQGLRCIARGKRGLPSLEEEAARVLEQSGTDYVEADGCCPNCGNTTLGKPGKVQVIMNLGDPGKRFLLCGNPVLEAATPWQCTVCRKNFIVRE